MSARPFGLLPARAALATLLTLGSTLASGYPIDGRARSGIRRLDGYLAAQADPSKGVPKLLPGALLGSDEIQLGLAGKNEHWDLARAEKDPALQAALEAMLAKRDPSYAIALVDISNPEAPVWAGLRENTTNVPQSVGKVMVLVGLFDALRRAFPDPEERLRVLCETEVEASDWAFTDSHTVPIYDAETGRNRNRPIQRGDRFRLSEWVDHMVSSSANAGGSIVWKEAMLLREFGSEYPVSAEREAAFFRTTPKARLGALSVEVLEEPLRAAGLDVSALRQGTFFTRGGQARVPGTASFASPKQLARLLVLLEQGRLVDAWSSQEMKRYLYMTKRRYRYAYAPELASAAVYFKSGSHYKCKPEAEFKCGKYRGNVHNLMNSIAMVESPARDGSEPKRYIVALMSNVLRVNSAWDHSRIAAAIEQAVRTRRPAAIQDQGAAAEISSAGRSE